MDDARNDPVLSRFRAALAAAYGDRIERVVLSTEILCDTGAVIAAMPFLAGAHRQRTGFMHEPDGVDL